MELAKNGFLQANWKNMQLHPEGQAVSRGQGGGGTGQYSEHEEKWGNLRGWVRKEGEERLPGKVWRKVCWDTWAPAFPGMPAAVGLGSPSQTLCPPPGEWDLRLCL